MGGQKKGIRCKVKNRDAEAEDNNLGKYDYLHYTVDIPVCESI